MILEVPVARVEFSSNKLQANTFLWISVKVAKVSTKQPCVKFGSHICEYLTYDNNITLEPEVPIQIESIVIMWNAHRKKSFWSDDDCICTS